MRYVQGQDRHPATLFPETLDEFIAENNPVRFLDVFVNEQDCYWCLGGKRLTREFVDNKQEHIFYGTSSCLACSVRSQCTTNKTGRKIYRWKDEHLLEQMAQRVTCRPDITRQLKAVVEHPFGTFKRAMNQGYFLTRGLDKVRTEFSLPLLAFNLKGVFNLIDMPILLATARG